MKAERIWNELARGLPLRRAPAALEYRVCQELERRAAQPWWFRGFSQWPTGARVSFVAICSGIIGLSVGDGAWTMLARTLSNVAAAPLSWTHGAVALLQSACAVAALLLRVIPATWIYGALTAGVALYVALFGLSAAAYRAFYHRTSLAGDRQ
jgi:drug/metabolite transporter (DMT)-like permease